MSDSEPAVAPAAGEEPTTEQLEQAKQWQELMQKYTTGMAAASAPFMAGGMGGMPFPLGFSPAAFMLPAMMPYGNLSAYYGHQMGVQPAADGDVKPAAHDGVAASGSKDFDEEDEEDEDGEATPSEDDEEGEEKKKKKKKARRSASAPGSKKAKAEAGAAGAGGIVGMGVRSNSQAALALLASTAGGVKPGQTAAGQQQAQQAQQAVQQAHQQQAAQQANMFTEMWALNGQAVAAAAAAAAAAGAPGAVSSGVDLAQLGAVDEEALVGLDERDTKRLRRKQSNRESARRSRLRKQAECDTLQRENKALRVELASLQKDKAALEAQVQILEAKVAMSAHFGTIQGLPQAEADRLRAAGELPAPAPAGMPHPGLAAAQQARQ